MIRDAPERSAAIMTANSLSLNRAVFMGPPEALASVTWPNQKNGKICFELMAVSGTGIKETAPESEVVYHPM
ncbi:hypothetical protein GMSM_40390 [Geomonas sp. Red276]